MAVARISERAVLPQLVDAFLASVVAAATAAETPTPIKGRGKDAFRRQRYYVPFVCFSRFSHHTVCRMNGS